MAQTLVCDYCQQVEGMLMVGVIATGEQTVVCGYCAPGWAQTIIDALGGAKEAVDQAFANPAAPAADTVDLVDQEGGDDDDEN